MKEGTSFALVLVAVAICDFTNGEFTDDKKLVNALFTVEVFVHFIFI